jgi:hypothetical protein
MRDLFSSAANGYHYLSPLDDPFRWVCGLFAGDGAVQIIIRANENGLKTYYPIRRNIKGEYEPLWRSYLFIEWRETVTIDLCRTTTRFLRLISERDEAGNVQPVLVRRDAINESLRLMTQGKFDDVTFRRQFRGKGSIVRVIDDIMADKTVRLSMDVTPDMSGNRKVLIDINGVKATIKLYQLAL